MDESQSIAPAAHLRQIQEKVQSLVRQHRALQKENAQLRSDLAAIERNAVERHAELNALKQRSLVSGVRDGGLNEEEKTAFRNAIDLYLKEIDKCLQLINREP